MHNDLLFTFPLRRKHPPYELLSYSSLTTCETTIFRNQTFGRDEMDKQAVTKAVDGGRLGKIIQPITRTPPHANASRDLPLVMQQTSAEPIKQSSESMVEPRQKLARLYKCWSERTTASNDVVICLRGAGMVSPSPDHQSSKHTSATHTYVKAKGLW